MDLLLSGYGLGFSLMFANGWQYEKCRIQRTNLSNFK